MMYKSPDNNKSGIIAYLLLIGISFLSALAISSLSNLFPTENLGLAAIVPYFMISIAQMTLAIIASFSIIRIFAWLSKKNNLYDINTVFLTGIPLFFNALAAFSLTISWIHGAEIFNWARVLTNARLYENMTLIVVEENIILNPPDVENSLSSGYRYHATLRVENNTDLPINYPEFILGAFDAFDIQQLPRYILSSSHFLGIGRMTSESGISTGISNIVIDISVVPCRYKDVTKPLYILYNIGEKYKPITVGDNINKQLQEIGCGLVH